MNSESSTVNQAPRIDRDAALQKMRDTQFDLVVVGGGITGAGIAREAAMQGLSVALLEAQDFASGTSSRSTKLIHGGLRYLAMGDVLLVREAALERKAVHAMAPHLAEPRWLMIPTANWLAAMKYRAAVTVYERLGAVALDQTHQNWSGVTLQDKEPLLETGRWQHACAYLEYLTDDARLVLGVMRAAVQAGACAANYLRAQRIVYADDAGSASVCGIEVEDSLTDERFTVRASMVVNACGPWADTLAETGIQDRLHLSKGSHIVLSAERLPVQQLSLLELEDGRLIFVIPRDSVVYVGTTDTSYEGSAQHWPEVESWEVDYLLAAVRRYYKVPDLGRKDVLTAWAGLRPLIAQPGKSAREMSRKDEIWVDRRGVITIAGGKLTGFRHMAAEIMERVALLRGERYHDPRDVTPVPGGDFSGDLAALARNLQLGAQIDSAQARRLARLYGSEATAVCALGVEPLGQGLIAGEIAWAVHTEAAQTLEDLVYRRTRLAMFESVQASTLTAIADTAAPLLGWDEAQQGRQLAQVQKRLDQDNAQWRDL